MRKVPNSELVVSELCLGTMIFGDQVGKEPSMRLLDLATKEYGINFLVINKSNIYIYIFISRFKNFKLFILIAFIITFYHCN